MKKRGKDVLWKAEEGQEERKRKASHINKKG